MCFREKNPRKHTHPNSLKESQTSQNEKQKLQVTHKQLPQSTLSSGHPGIAEGCEEMFLMQLANQPIHPPNEGTRQVNKGLIAGLIKGNQWFLRVRCRAGLVDSPWIFEPSPPSGSTEKPFWWRTETFIKIFAYPSSKRVRHIPTKVTWKFLCRGYVLKIDPKPQKNRFHLPVPSIAFRGKLAGNLWIVSACSSDRCGDRFA